MIIGLSKYENVYGIDDHLAEIEAFLQGAVYCWCKNAENKEGWFAARTLLGGDNYYWQDTPMMYLFRYYYDGDEANGDYAIEEAGKAAGRILKKILIQDKREFETREGFTREYRWTGNEDNSIDRTATN